MITSRGLTTRKGAKKSSCGFDFVLEIWEILIGEKIGYTKIPLSHLNAVGNYLAGLQLLEGWRGRWSGEVRASHQITPFQIRPSVWALPFTKNAPSSSRTQS